MQDDFTSNMTKASDKYQQDTPSEDKKKGFYFIHVRLSCGTLQAANLFGWLGPQRNCKRVLLSRVRPFILTGLWGLFTCSEGRVELCFCSMKSMVVLPRTTWPQGQELCLCCRCFVRTVNMKPYSQKQKTSTLALLNIPPISSLKAL